MLSKLDSQTASIRLRQASDFFGNMSGLMNTHSKKAFQIGQAAAIAQALVSTYAAAQAAFAGITSATGGWGIAAAVAAAAAAVGTGMANVAQIRSQKMPGFAFGGAMEVTGTGGTDSQTVAFRATPGETVRVTTPSQESEAARNGKGGGDTMIFNMPGITNATQARKSRSQIQRSVVTTVSTGKRFK